MFQASAGSPNSIVAEEKHDKSASPPFTALFVIDIAIADESALHV